MKIDLDKDLISRIAVAFLEKEPSLIEHGEKVFEVIEQRLLAYKLCLICDDQIKTSTSLQAALLTAINTGKRCFKGGVTVILKTEVQLLIKWPNHVLLNDACKSLGAKIINENNNESYSVKIALGHSEDQTIWRILANDWTGGVIPPDVPEPTLPGDQSFPLGGILAGALAVATTFLKFSGFEKNLGLEPVGLSLWRPELVWTLPEAQGPTPKTFPDKLWLLGLGHLGQGYAWCIGLLPFKAPKDFLVKLQDDDKAVLGNLDSGLLCEIESIGKYKTRVVASWLEDRGIETRIIERKYHEEYHRQDDDPKILLAGLDKLAARKMLKVDEFKLVIDCGLGAGLNFDTIRINVFPNIKIAPIDLWKDSKEAEATPVLKSLTQKLKGCGYTVGIATAFIGCISGCITVSEVLRSYHQGVKLSNHYSTIRELVNSEFRALGFYGTETFSGLTEFE